MVVTEFGIYKSVIPELKKAYAPMVSNDSGKLSDVTADKLLKAEPPMVSIESPKVKEVIELTPRKAASPISTSEFGSATEVNAVWKKAYDPIEVTESGMFTEVIDAAPTNASVPIWVTPLAITTAPTHPEPLPFATS